MRKRASSDATKRPSSDEIAAVTAELAAIKSRLDRMVRGEPALLTDEEIVIGSRYCVKTGPNRNKLVSAVAVDRAKWERQGHFIYLLEKPAKGSGPSTYTRRAEEIFPCGEIDDPEE